MIFSYLKYRAVKKNVYGEGVFGERKSGISSNTYKYLIYDSYKFDAALGYIGQGTSRYLEIQHLPEQSIAVLPMQDEAEGYYIRKFLWVNPSTIEHNTSFAYEELIPVVSSSHYVKGTYITTIQVEEGTFPDDGRHTDGYWYVKSSEVNIPPGAPEVTFPNGGEVITAPNSIMWNHALDPNGHSLTYQIEITIDNGKTWSRIANKQSATSYNFSFEGFPDTSTAKIRIRAFDGQAYGDWGESDGVFTINYNIPPTPPHELSPFNGEIVDVEKTVRFIWKHSDPNGSDPQSKFELRWRPIGDVWKEISETTTRTYQDIPANTLPLGQIEWQVRTYDQAGLVSEWSNLVIFTSASKPETAIWVYPTNGMKITEAKPTFQWSSNVQTASRVILYDDNDFILWDTGEIEGISKAVTTSIALEDGANYSVSVLIRNAENFWSDEEKIAFNTSYSPPPKPTFDLYGSDASVVIEINNPDSTGTQPQTVNNEVYKLIDKEWVRIARNIPPNSAFVDYTARSGVVEQYQVKAVGDNEGIRYSDILSVSIKFVGVYLHDTQDPETTVKQFKFDGGGRSSNWSKNYTMMKFKGRKMPIVEFAESEDRSVSVTLQLLNTEDLLTLEELAKSYNTLCYRDGRGRLLFGFIPSLPTSDERFGYQVNFEFIGIDYKGSV